MVVLSSRQRRGAGTIKVFAWCEWEALLLERASKRHADYLPLHCTIRRSRARPAPSCQARIRDSDDVDD